MGMLSKVHVVVALMLSGLLVAGCCCPPKCPPRCPPQGPSQAVLKQSPYAALDAEMPDTGGRGGKIRFRGFTVVNLGTIPMVGAQAKFFNDWDAFVHPGGTTGDDHAKANALNETSAWMPLGTGPIAPGGSASASINPATGLDVRVTRACVQVQWSDGTTQYYTVSTQLSCTELKFFGMLKVNLAKDMAPVVDASAGGAIPAGYRPSDVPKTHPMWNDLDFVTMLYPYSLVGYYSNTSCDNENGGPPASTTDCSGD